MITYDEWKGRSPYERESDSRSCPDCERTQDECVCAVSPTGRLPRREPELQNIPIRTALGRKIRATFVAPPERRIALADYSQTELRVLAALEEEEDITW